MPEVACAVCGAANPSSNRFCGACGSSLERACPECGTDNPASNRFCGRCGSPLDATATASPATRDDALGVEERKVVTVMFADLTASTEMASRLDPEDLRAVLRPFFDAMVDEIARYGGTVEKFIGDAIVAVFGAPVAHEDDPERAVACALTMHRRLSTLNAELSSRAGGDLSMRIGINTGEVVTHSLDEGIATGEAVNVTARLEALAEPGTVVVGERTHRHARDAFAFTDLGEATVKGIDRPLRVWRVDGEGAGPRQAGPVRETPFVGRASEMELVRILFDRAVEAGRPHLVTIVGPPGIGKSRLSHEVARALGGERARVVRGRCLPYGDGLTYWPLAEILKADAGILDSDAAPMALEKAATRIDRRFPGEEGMGITAVLLSSIGFEVPSDPLAGADAQAAKRVIERAWQRYAESLCADGPVLALLEDIHWGDPNLLDLIETLVARSSGAALVLCMARPELFERRPDWGRGVTNGTTLSLSPLSTGDGTALIRFLLDGEAPSEVLGPILRRAEGNPFFAGELLRMVIEDGTLARTNGSWRLTRDLPASLPDTVQGVIASRIDLLPAAEKRAIQDASVVGRVFWAGAVERLGAADGDVALDGLVAKGLVREREGSALAGERELIFNHILTRDVAYASITRTRRAEAHAAIGRWVEEVTAGREEEFAEILAYHFERAGDAARTARYAMLAGNRQLRVFAAEQAIDWYDRALDVAPKDDGATRARIGLMRGRALEQIGRFEETLAAFDEALSAARDASDRDLAARALAARAHVLWLLDRYDEGDEVLPAALERARAAGLADVEARLLYTAGTMRFGRAAFADALSFHERALEVARANGDREGEALAHHGLCETYFFVGPPTEGLEHGQRADALLRQLGQKPMVAHNAYMISWAQGFLGRWDEARSTVDDAILGCRETGNRRDEAFALFNRSEIHLAQGDIGPALDDVETAIEIVRELDLRRGMVVGLNVRHDVLMELWAFDRLVPSADEALAISDELPGAFMRSIALAAAAFAALVGGDDVRAEELFVASRASDVSMLDVAWPAQNEVLAWEWAARSDRLRDVAASIDRRIDRGDGIWWLWADYARALADLVDARWDEAAARARASLETSAALPYRRVAWRAASVLARALDALGRRDEAARVRADARPDLERIRSTTPEAMRAAFDARPDVAALLA